MIYQNMYKHPKFGNLVANPLQEALISFDKSLALDPKSDNVEDIQKRKAILVGQLGDQGADQYKEGKFAEALNSFETILKITPTDSAVMFNCAIAAEKAGDKEKAKTYYNNLIAQKYPDVKVYLLLASLYREEKNEAKAFEVVQKGRAMFPEDNNLMIEELNYYLANGRSAEAIASLEKAIAADPGNASLYLAQGNMLDKAGQSEKAAESYKKAISIRPDYFDAYYNLGAMYFNQGAEMANKANDIPTKEIQKYNDAKKKFDAKFREAQPYLEKAWELNPTDVSTMTSLKQLYMRLEETEKLNKVRSRVNKNKGD
jgi:tetratricopeptide (TPR) repeat protein